MMVLKILGIVAIGIFIVAVVAVLFLLIESTLWFQQRRCKFCGHIMDYKGLKEDSDMGHYLFHCEHCGAWEQVSRKEFLQNKEKEKE